MVLISRNILQSSGLSLGHKNCLVIVLTLFLDDLAGFIFSDIDIPKIKRKGLGNKLFFKVKKKVQRDKVKDTLRVLNL
jgi:hypothetical protein